MAFCFSCRSSMGGRALNYCENCGTSLHRRAASPILPSPDQLTSTSSRLAPSNINEVANWPDLDSLNPDEFNQFWSEFEGVAGQLNYAAAEEISWELSGMMQAMVVGTCAYASTDLVRMLRFLHLGLRFVDIWPTPNSDGFHTEFLELMWQTVDEVRAANLRPAEADRLLSATLAFPEPWTIPVTAAAIVACSPITKAAVNSTLAALAASGSYNMREAAPLAALLCVHPETDLQLAVTIAVMYSNSQWLGEANSFWEYVYASLTQPNTDGWIPTRWWGDGFFYSSLKEGEPKVGTRQRSALLQFFRAHYHEWDVANIYGETYVIDHLLALEPGPLKKVTPMANVAWIARFPPTTDSLYCQRCGTEASSNSARFCGECGEDFASPRA